MHDTLRPRLELFANEAIDRIVDQAIEVLNDVGIRVEDSEALNAYAHVAIGQAWRAIKDLG